jgi:putative peptidoglycan lipid II flippase
MPEEATNLRRNALLVGAANFLSRITGLLREVAMAAVFGAGVQADAFNTAFRIGSLFRELFAEGSLSSAFVPLYADVEEKEGAESAFALANAFLGVLLLAGGAVALLTFFAAEPLVHAFAEGYAEIPGKVELSTTLTRLLSPFVAAVSVAAVFMGILNVRGRFFLPAAAPLIFNALTIGACIGADAFGRATGLDPILGVAIAALIGGAGQALIQAPALMRTGYRFSPSFGGHPALKRLLKFVAPALIAISVVQVNLLIEMRLASGEGDGPVSWLQYAFRIVHLPLSIISVAVGVSALAGLSVLAAQDKREEFRKTLAHALNLNSFLIIPAAVGLFCLAAPVVSLLLERGAFTPEDTAATASVLQMYCLAVLGIGAHRVLVPVYYTLNDPWTPMWAGAATMLIKYPVAWALMHPLGLGVQGLPLSHGVLVTAEVTFLIAVLARRIPGLTRALIADHARVLVAAAAMGGLVWFTRGWADGGGPAGLLGLVGVIGVGAASYFVLSAVLGLSEGREILMRMMKRRPRGLPPTVPPETAAALEALSGAPQAPAVLADGAARVVCEDRAVVIRALDGALIAEVTERRPGDPSGDALSPRPVAAVMRVGGGPPKLAGLKLGEQELRADGDAVAGGPTSGPVIPLGQG